MKFTFFNKNNRSLTSILSLTLLLLISSCGNTTKQNEVIVDSAEALTQAISEAKPGTDIIMTNGDWTDIEIRFSANGTVDPAVFLTST